MNMSTRAASIAAAAGLCLSSAALAQSNQSSMQSNRQGQPSWQQNEPNSQRAQQQPWNRQGRSEYQQKETIRGTIDSIRTATFRGDRHVVLFLETERGFEQVDLGSLNQVRPLANQLEEGSHVNITGHVQQIGGRDVIFAERVQVNGEWHQAGHAQQMQSSRAGQQSWERQQDQQNWRQQDRFEQDRWSQTDQRQQSGSQNAQWFTGTIQSTSTKSINNEQHLTIALETERGVQQADLGPVSDIQELRPVLKEGKPLLISGSHDMIDGERMIKVETISFPTGYAQMNAGETQRQARGQQQTGQQMQSFDGTIQSVNVASVQNQQHLIVGLQTDHGLQHVNLGPVNEVQSLRSKLQEGQQLKVTGSKIDLQGRQMVVVRSAEMDGENLQINRQFAQRHLQSQAPGQRILGTDEGDGNQDMKTLRGQIQSVNTTTIEEKQMLVATIETREGTKRVLLGESSKLGNVRDKLSEGAQLSVEGKETQKQGQTYFKAKSVTIDGQTHEIQSDHEKKDKP